MQQPTTIRPIARPLWPSALLLSLLAFSCTQAPGDINVTLDPTNITSYILGTTQAPAIILYSTSTSYSGALGGRAGADALCAADRANANRICASVHAVISLTSSTDEIAGMASTYSLPTYPVKSPGGTVIGNNWADLLDGSIASRLDNAGVSSAGYWTFSDTAGALDAANACKLGGTGSPGTSGESGQWGAFGDVTSLGAAWLASGSKRCDVPARLLCICY